MIRTWRQSSLASETVTSHSMLRNVNSIKPRWNSLDTCSLIRASVDPKKVATVKKAPAPKNPGEVRSFLGLVTYCGRFIPGLATLTEPLRELTKKDRLWNWSPIHQSAFDTFKNALSGDTVLAFFDQ